MSWSNYKLGDIAIMKYGKMPPRDVVSIEGYPIFSGYRITGYAKEYNFDEPRLIVVARGVGGTGDVKISPEKSWITNLSIVLDLDETKFNKKFLFYKLGREPLKEKLNTGAAQAQITIDTLKSYSLSVPNLHTQNRIVHVLATYDDLIENNRRRIALLEQAARMLYKEWFVHLRFPGHEHVKIIDGVPVGWKKSLFGDLGDVVTGKTPSTKHADNFGDDVPFIKTPDMHGTPIVLVSEQSLSEKGANSQSNKYIPAGSVMVSCIGSVGVVALNSKEAQTNQQINTVVPKKDYLRHYAYFALNDLKPRLEAFGGGATMANVNKSKFESLPVSMPPKPILAVFDEFAKPIFKQMNTLILTNLKLSCARDLLLPRLMNGEIAV